MRIRKLRLKNFKGIKCGLLRRDEIVLDFTALPDGLIAIRGANGAGKTTVLDNLHPFRIMPFREELNLADVVDGIGEKELEFEIGGKLYKSLLKINSKSRSQEAYLYVHNPEKNNWEILVEGRTSSYDKEIEERVCPQHLFFLANFRSQGAKSFTAYKKSDLKRIFEELIGLEYLREIGKKAGEKRKETAKLIESFEREKESLEQMLAELPQIESVSEAEIKQLEFQLKGGEKKLEEIEKKLVDLKGKHSSLSEKLQGIKDKRKQIESSFVEKSNLLEKEKKHLERKNTELSEVLRNKDTILEASEQLSGLQKKLEVLQKKVAERESLAKKKEVLLGKKAQIEADGKGTKATYQQLKEQLSKLGKTAKILKEVPCSSDIKQKCKLLKNSIKASKEIPKIKEKITSLYNKLSVLAKEYQKVKSEIKILDKQISELPTTEDLTTLNNQIQRMQKIASQRPLLEGAQRQIEENNKRLKEIDKDFENLNKQKIQILQSLQEEEKKILIKLQQITNEGKKFVEEKEVCKKQVEAAQKALKELEIREQRRKDAEQSKKQITTRLSEIGKSITEHTKNFEQWKLIEKGFSQNGIIAFELELASPTVSKLANLLLETIDNKFRVRFETLKPKKRSKDEYVETFDIKVLNTETGGEESLVALSGGERVWVEEALARAIGIYLSQNSPNKIETLFSDERDGALDEKKKLEYIRMKRAVLEVGKYSQEFFVSHTPDLWDLADAVISFSRKGVEVEIKSGPRQGERIRIDAESPDVGLSFSNIQKESKVQEKTKKESRAEKRKRKSGKNKNQKKKVPLSLFSLTPST